MLSQITRLLGAPLEAIVNTLDRRAERSHLENIRTLEIDDERHARRIDNIREGRQAEEDWNLASIQNAGWKDDFITGLYSIPLVMAFVPFLAQYALEGFEVLEMMPDWYIWSVGAVLCSALGLRGGLQVFERFTRTRRPNPRNRDLTGETS